MRDEAKRQTWSRLLGLLFVYDLFTVTTPSTVILVFWLELSDLHVFLGLMLTRLVIAYVHCHRSFEPLRRWETRTGPLEDTELLALDRGLHRAPRAFAVRYMLGLVVTLGLATTFGLLGVAVEVEIGRPELSMLGLLTLGLLVGVAPSFASLLGPRLLWERLALADELMARGLEGQRAPASMASWSARLNVPSVAAIFFSTVAILGLVAIDGWREAGLDHRELDAHVDVIMLFALLMPIVFIGPLLTANLWVSRMHTQQFVAVREAMRRLLTGGGLGEIERVRSPSNDELGQLTQEFNRMLDVFEELAIAAQAVADGDLTVELTRAGQLHAAFGGMLARLQELVTQLQATAHQLTVAAADVQLSVGEHEQVILEQSRNVDEISMTLEQLVLAATNVSSSAAGVLDNADQTLTNADAMGGEITALTSHTAAISELLERVREIAARSDLLALNGSLEATRAGEAGRGFALVAAEMRRLAERIAGTVVDMQGRVGDIGGASASTVDATERTRTLAEQTAAAARSITKVIESQSEDTRRAVGAMYDLGVHVDASAMASASTRKSADQLTQMAQTLGGLLGEFRVDVDTSEKFSESPSEPTR